MNDFGYIEDGIYHEIWIILSLKNEGNKNSTFYSLSSKYKFIQVPYKSEVYFESFEMAQDFFNKMPLAIKNQVKTTFVRVICYDYYADEFIENYQRKIK